MLASARAASNSAHNCKDLVNIGQARADSQCLSNEYLSAFSSGFSSVFVMDSLASVNIVATKHVNHQLNPKPN